MPRTISGSIARDRSAYDSSMFSKSYRNRGGAGVSGSGRGASGRSNSSRPRFVAERHEPRPKPLEDLGELGQAAPRLGVHDAGRSEGGQVARHDRIDGRQLLGRLAEPRLDRRVGDRPAPAPQPPRRHLDERHAGPHRLLQPEPVPIRPARQEVVAERLERPRLLVHEGAAHRHDLVLVDARQALAELSLLDPIHDRLDERPEAPRVPGRDEVDRPAHERHADDRPIDQQIGRAARPGSPRGASTARRRRCAGSGPASRRDARGWPGRTAWTGAGGAVDRAWPGSGRGR